MSHTGATAVDAVVAGSGPAGSAATAPVIGPILAGGWSIYWNDLLAGAANNPNRLVAHGLDAAVRRAFPVSIRAASKSSDGHGVAGAGEGSEGSPGAPAESPARELVGGLRR